MPMTEAMLLAMSKPAVPKLSSEDIAQQVAEFKANGGEVQEIPTGATAWVPGLGAPGSRSKEQQQRAYAHRQGIKG